MPKPRHRSKGFCVPIHQAMHEPLILVADRTLDPRVDGPLLHGLAEAGLRRVWLRVEESSCRKRLAAAWREIWPHILTVGNDPSLAGEGVGYHEAACLSPRIDAPRPYSRSAHNARELSVAEECGCDYAIFGTVWASRSHPEGAVCGVDQFAEFVSGCKIPLVAIGGITPERAGSVRQAGGAGFAVRSGILQAKDPAQAVRSYLEAWSAVKSTATSCKWVKDSSDSGTVQTAKRLD